MRVLKNTKGQTMVEFALVITLFLAILFGIVEFGRFMWYSNHLGNSVRAAARFGAVYANSSTIPIKYGVSSIESQTVTYANVEIGSFIKATPGTSPGQFSVTARIFPNATSATPRESGTAKRGDILKVRAAYRMQILTGTIIPFFSGPKTIARSASMPIE